MYEYIYSLESVAGGTILKQYTYGCNFVQWIVLYKIYVVFIYAVYAHMVVIVYVEFFLSRAFYQTVDILPWENDNYFILNM